jgi:hypothetical protein
MNRTSECKYDDSGRKSHTRKLLEHQEALEARLRELECERRNSRPSTSGNLSIEAPTPTTLPQSTTLGVFDTLSSTPLPSMDPLWDFQIRPSSTSSATLSDRSVSIPLGLAYHSNLPAAPPVAFTEPSVHDATPDRALHESIVTLSVEMHNSLYVFPFRYLVLFPYDDLMIESKCSLSTESNAVSTLMSAVSTHRHRPLYSKIRRPVLHS